MVRGTRCAVISGGNRALRTAHASLQPRTAYRAPFSLTVPAPPTKMPDPRPSFHRIEELPQLVGQTVLTRGWVTTTRSSGKIAFVVLRDGTGYLQVVLSKKEVPEAAWEAFGRLTQETSLEVTGMVRSDARAPGGV